MSEDDSEVGLDENIDFADSPETLAYVKLRVRVNKTHYMTFLAEHPKSTTHAVH